MYALVYPGVLRLLPRCVSAFGLSAVCQLKWKNNRQVKDGTALGSLTPQFDPQYLNGHNRLDVPVRSGAQARMRVSSGAFDPPWPRHAPSPPIGAEVCMKSGGAHFGHAQNWPWLWLGRPPISGYLRS